MQNHGVRYMLIGGIAVNFHGVERHTNDMDIWLAPTNINRDLFFDALLDLEYTEEELADLKREDFTTFFKCSIGSMPDTIDCLTIGHATIEFDQAEKEMIKHDIGNGLHFECSGLQFSSENETRYPSTKRLVRRSSIG
jgi:hypothetical protein